MDNNNSKQHQLVCTSTQLNYVPAQFSKKMGVQRNSFNRNQNRNSCRKSKHGERSYGVSFFVFLVSFNVFLNFKYILGAYLPLNRAQICYMMR